MERFNRDYIEAVGSETWTVGMFDHLVVKFKKFQTHQRGVHVFTGSDIGYTGSTIDMAWRMEGHQKALSEDEYGEMQFVHTSMRRIGQALAVVIAAILEADDDKKLLEFIEAVNIIILDHFQTSMKGSLGAQLAFAKAARDPSLPPPP